MYDEFGNKENEDQYVEEESAAQGAFPETDLAEAHSAETDFAGEAFAENGAAETDFAGEGFAEAEDTGEVFETEQNDTEILDVPAADAEQNENRTEFPEQDAETERSFYHYSYEKQDRQETGTPVNGYQHTQYYQNGQYHQRTTQSAQDGHGQNGYDPNRYAQNGYGRNDSFDPAGRNPKKKGRKAGMIAAVCIAVALIGGGTAVAWKTGQIDTGVKETEAKAELQTRKESEANPETSETKATEAPQMSAAAGVPDIPTVAENAMPSIVAITNKGVEEVQSLFFGRTQYQQTESSGSGVIIAKNDKELLIATNNHVVADAQELSVCFTVDTEKPEDAVVNAQVKGTDSDHDLAVVAVLLSDISEDVKGKLKVAVMGDSDALKIGTQVLAIGNALGYGQSLTVGYVSALNREVTIDNMTNYMIQTDAAINFGNSGGALLDTNGNLIGINSAKAADTGVEGMGYAIPVNTASPILDELMNRTTRSKVASEELGFLGVDPRDVSEEARQIYNLPAGAFVYSVVEGSPAETAGIKKGDIITKLDGITIGSRDELFARMEYYKAGETIEVVVKTAEGGEYIERIVSVTLAKKSQYSDDTSSESEGTGMNPEDGQQGEGTQPYPDGDDDGYRYEGNYGEGYGEGYENSVDEFFRQFMW